MINNSYFNSSEDYLKFYGLEDAPVRYESVPFESDGFKLAGAVFEPAEYKATVVILHGYLGHSGLMSKLIRYLTGIGCAVAAFDLPGHGLSSGERTAIDDFSQYTDSLNVFLGPVRQKLHGPYHIIGFSTGAAVMMDYLFSNKDDCFDKVILAAPLVRSDRWYLSKIGYQICKPFCKNIPRLFRRVSSDEDFLRFIRNEDPMSAKKVSLKWVEALLKWNKKIEDTKNIARQVLVIQGTCENTVAWKYNLKFIRSKFKRVEIELIENGRHELFNESEKIRQEVFVAVKDYLED